MELNCLSEEDPLKMDKEKPKNKIKSETQL